MGDVGAWSEKDAARQGIVVETDARVFTWRKSIE